MKKLIILGIVLLTSCNANFFYIKKTICVHGDSGEIITSGSRVEDAIKGNRQEANGEIDLPLP